MKRRLLASLLTLVMMLSLLPTAVCAANGKGQDEQTVYAVGEEIPVSGLSGEVTISGYMDEKDWYVTDGLVLMYDGIYNEGMNQTNSEAATWTELTGNGAAMPVGSLAWGNNGLVSNGASSGEAKVHIDTSAFTYNAAFAGSNFSDIAPHDGSGYFDVFKMDSLGNVGRIRRDGVILNYHAGSSNVLSTGVELTDDQLNDMAITSDGNTARASYLNGKYVQQALKDSKVEQNYTTTKVSVPANINLPSSTETTLNSDGKTVPEYNVTLNKTVYGLRLYTKALSKEELDQNTAIDKARFQDKTYVAPGSVTVGSGTPVALTECTFVDGIGHVGETTVDVGENGELMLQLTHKGKYTLTFTQGETVTTKDVKIISEADKNAADAVKDNINRLPDANDLTLKNLNAVAEAQTAYNALSDVQKERVGQTLADKLNACVAKIDELAADTLEITLTYDVNGGTLPNDITSMTIKYKAEYTLDVPTRKNFRFDGWYLGQTQLTDSDGKALAPWANLQGATITAHWTNNAEVEGASLEINEAEDIYALARILGKTGSEADYQRFGYAKSDESLSNLQQASYVLKQDISLTDQNNTFYGIPNFKGTFDGDGKTINVDFKLAGDWNTVKFGCLISNLDGGTVKNVNFTGTLGMKDDGAINAANSLQDVAVVAGYTQNGATIQDVTSDVTMNLEFSTTSGSTCVYVGAFAGRASGGTDKLVNCVNNGKLTATFTGFTANGGCRLGGLVGHAYSGVTFDKCKNNGDIDSSASNTKTLTGGMIGSGASNCFTDCELSGDVKGNGVYAVGSYNSMSANSTGNVMLVAVSGTADQTIAYSGDASQTVTLTDANTTATFRIPVEKENGVIENNAFAYAQYLTVNGKRLDWFSVDSMNLTLKLNSGNAANLEVPFQTESNALVLTTEADLLNLQKALSSGDQAAIDALYALGNKTVSSYSEARAALETAYYKLGGNITVTDSAFTGIGTSGTPFSGHFDGQGNTVTLQNNPTISGTYGLFGYVNTGANGVPVIENLNVVANTTVTLNNSNAYVGTLAGVLYSGELKNIKSTVTKLTVSGPAGNNKVLHLGGLIGNAVPSSVSNVSAEINGPLTADVEAADNIYLGGGFGSCVLPGPVTVTYNSNAQLSAGNKKYAGGISIGGLIGYNASGSMDLRGSKLVNTADSALAITAKGSGPVHAGGWVGFLTDATAAADKWLYADETTVMEGEFAVVTAECTNSSVFAGGVVGMTNVAFSVSIENYLNTVAVSGKIVGGLIGYAANSGENKLVSIENSANGGVLTGTTVGGLIGQLDASNSKVTFEDALYVKTSSVTKAVGNQNNDAVGIIALNADTITNGIFSGTLTGVLSANAPAALTVSDNVKLDGTSLTYTEAGEQAIIFYWNSTELYRKTVTVTAKDMSSETVEIIGVSNSYADDTAAGADLDDVRVIYNGTELVKGTDYTISAADGKFTITFKGNYSGTKTQDYARNTAFTATANSLTVTYDGKPHSIKVETTPAEGVNVQYKTSSEGTYSDDVITLTDVGTVTVYWKATKGGMTITGSAVLTITKAAQDISYETKSVSKRIGAANFTNKLTVNEDKTFGEITYESSNESVAKVNAATGEVTIVGVGTAVITATAAGSDNYDKASASYTLTVSRRASAPSATTPDPEPEPDDGLPFTDVPKSAYYYDAVDWAVGKEITDGVSATQFAPYASCTRAQIVTFLWRAAGSPEPKTMSSFTDVPASAYYVKAVAWAVENGITNGMTETTFAPNATCTRGQSVTFLYRALKGTASGSANFTDVKSDAFYADAINWAVANNVTNGTSNTTFSPNADCTRAEIVTFLYRAYQGK